MTVIKNYFQVQQLPLKGERVLEQNTPLYINAHTVVWVQVTICELLGGGLCSPSACLVLFPTTVECSYRALIPLMNEAENNLDF